MTSRLPIDPAPVPARYVRVTATRLWARTDDRIFALGELALFAEDAQVARGAEVSAQASPGRYAAVTKTPEKSRSFRRSDV